MPYPPAGSDDVRPVTVNNDDMMRLSKTYRDEKQFYELSLEQLFLAIRKLRFARNALTVKLYRNDTFWDELFWTNFPVVAERESYDRRTGEWTRVHGQAVVSDGNILCECGDAASHQSAAGGQEATNSG